ncbi:hypothetical protein PNEG_01582 [Pneumocystis murina B123]|uniref:Uncharacterized protein n=1 Tax=Pneumocystis murina (strain B123) TaxID=1069680 RepID=M7NTC3_PNEMU|nr:hypothetical protein PNEG_01582 [Pneumocystis murina B123]EMR10326.1 hypothetical protein PNEG_01582 [Pneumocystis murina B123]
MNYTRIIKYVIRSKNLNSVFERLDPYDKEIKEYFAKYLEKNEKELGEFSKKELKILKKTRSYVYRLDYSAKCFCCEMRFGWSAIIGMIPVIGDIINLYLSMRIIKIYMKTEISKTIIIQMYINIFIAFSMGLIPIIGDMLFAYYKCNIRNYIMFEKTLKERKKIH